MVFRSTLDPNTPPRGLLDSDIVLITAAGRERRAAHTAQQSAAKTATAGRTRQDQVFVVRRQEHATVRHAEHRVAPIDPIHRAKSWLDTSRSTQAIVDIQPKAGGQIPMADFH